MSCNITIFNKIGLLSILLVMLSIPSSHGQETESLPVGSNNPYHNQLFFNRFLINPTFSLVRENKSYLNILHRNQYATFEDNSQNYFLTFSNRLNENTALGIGVYSRWSGVIQEFGFNANYATAVQLGQKTKLTFGTNVTYFNEGLDKNRIVADQNDPELLDARKESKVAIQPGMALTVGRFDFGLYAENLFNYNQSTNEFQTGISEKNLKASVQYTHPFTATRGLFANARLMPLVQLGKNEDNSLSYVGALLLDLPNYGWFQSTVDDKFGMSVGLGFNLSKKMSLGYLMEKNVFDKQTDLGWNHELSLAYTFKDNTSDYGDNASISTDAKIDNIIKNYEEQILQLKADNAKALAANNQQTYKKAGLSKVDEAVATSPGVASNATLAAKKESNKRKDSRKLRRKKSKSDLDEYQQENSLAYQNSLILDELILRQDSIERARNKEFEKRFETIVRFLRHDIKRTIDASLEDHNAVPNSVLASNEAAPKPTTSKTTVHRNLAKPAKIEHRAVRPVINNAKPAAVAVTKKLKDDRDQRFNAEALKGYIQTAENANRPENTAVVKVAQNTSTKKEGYVKEVQPKNPQKRVETTENLNIAEHKDYVKLPIKILNRSDIAGVEPGYYLIANVYSNKRYLKAFVNSLTKQGLNAKQFYNRENGLYYVYLADFKMKEDARTAVVSNLSGKYSDEKWIMQVSDPIATAQVHFED
ncbi:MAG: PorP/SprF family type IX secretion system membrane protein [Flavobacteriaceae bacterium]